jgi:uncharacterized metal-binding protein
MTGTQPCSYGQNEPKRIIFPCAGLANVGQLTNLAALQLTDKGQGSIACDPLLTIGAETLIATASLMKITRDISIVSTHDTKTAVKKRELLLYR